MVLAIVQARLSSTRLPGKVLMPILGRPMLWWQLERVKLAKNIDRLVVATSDQSEDRQLVDMCREFGIECFCGSLDDVLDRFYRAASHYDADHIVRLTGDCPVADPQVIDAVIECYRSGNCDYASNISPPTFPDGIDVEVMRFDCLGQAWSEAKLTSQREHVTPFIWQQPRRFKLANYSNETDYSHLRWTVDEPEDFEFITKVYEALYPTDSGFSMSRILSMLEKRPDLCELNAGFERNEGLEQSIMDDNT